MNENNTRTISSSGLPVYRVQFIDAESGQVLSDADVLTSSDCVKYTNSNLVVKETLGFKKGESINTDLNTIVDNLVYPYYAPEIISIQNMSLLPEFDKYITEDTKTYLEKGIVKDKFNLTIEIMAGSEILNKCSLVRIQNNTREEVDNRYISINPGLKAKLDFSVPKFTTDTRYFFEISDNRNVIKSVELDYEFVLPVYVGYAKDGLLDPSLPIEQINTYINNLIKQTDRVEKRIVETNSLQKSFFDLVVDKDNLCPFILVPLKWNSLIRIEDINGMDLIKFFGHDNNILLKTSDTNTDLEGYVLYVSKQSIDSKAKNRYLREITYEFTHDIDWKDLESEGEQTEILTGFDVLTPGPIDSRFVKESYDDLAYIAKPYDGLIVYIKNIKTYYKYNSGVWEVTNTSVRLYTGKPSDTMGGKMDISIDIVTGDIYQKTNSNIWVLKGNIRTGVII